MEMRNFPLEVNDTKQHKQSGVGSVRRWRAAEVGHGAAAGALARYRSLSILCSTLTHTRTQYYFCYDITALT